ncbi:Unknown protein [Striga hermonthica]|uniref:Uncharacterized protein n=1 Tax=Striga hermonthica TaxID=68872 RepID=A0A9N7NED4_STRHE|nr:Unknown protein [Striga hermonthica]
MATKVQANAFLPEFHSVVDLNGSANNSVGPTYHGYNDSMLQTGSNFMRKDGYLLRDLEKVRRTMLEHESIFRNQLRELHRLYGRQRELMNEIKSRELEKDDSSKDNKSIPILPPAKNTRSLTTHEPRLLTSSIFLKETDNLGHLDSRDTKLSLDLYVKRTNCHGDSSEYDYGKKKISDNLMLSGGEKSPNPCLGFNLAMKDFFQASSDNKNEKNGIKHSSYGSTEKWRFDTHSSVEGLHFGTSQLVDTRKELSHCLYTRTSVSRKKKKIFGFEISEGYDEYCTFNAAADISNIEPRGEKNDVIASYKNGKSSADLNGKITRENGFSRHLGMNRDWLQSQNSTGINSENVPCHRTENIQRKFFKNSDSMNSNSADSLPWFLKNLHNTCDTSKSKKSSYFMNIDSLQSYSENFFGKADVAAKGKFPNLEPENKILPPNISRDVENATQTEDTVHNKRLLSNSNIDLNLSMDLDLEAPAIIEPEPYPNQKNNPDEERDIKIAADAIIAMSSSSEIKNPRNHPPPSSPDRLTWLADVIIILAGQSGSHEPVPDAVPDGMDYFEYATLKLKDAKEEEEAETNLLHGLEENPSGGAKSSVRSKKGRRSRKDFRRDVLPGLVTLSRVEVNEDFQAFEELLKGGWARQAGPTRWGPPARSWRRRRRRVEAVGSGRAQEIELMGWGKKRQRCAAAAAAANGLCGPKVSCE